MNCTEFEKLSMNYFDGEANEEQIAALKEHMVNCDCCRESFDSMNRIIELMEEPEDFNIDDNFTQEIMSKIEAYEENRKKTAELLKKLVIPVSVFTAVMGVMGWLLLFKYVNFAYILYSFFRVSKIVVEVTVAAIISSDLRTYAELINTQLQYLLPMVLILFGIKLATEKSKDNNESHA